MSNYNNNYYTLPRQTGSYSQHRQTESKPQPQQRQPQPSDVRTSSTHAPFTTQYQFQQPQPTRGQPRQSRRPPQPQPHQDKYRREYEKQQHDIDQIVNIQERNRLMSSTVIQDAVVPLNSINPLVGASVVPIFAPESPPPHDRDAGATADDKELVQQPTSSIATNTYPQMYRDEPFYQQPQENLIVNPVPHYLTIDSRDRDREVWPNTNQYRIPLVAVDNDLSVMSPNVRYLNIYSISLLSCVVPNDGGVMFEPYLLLQIDEIDRVYDSANPACARAFTKLYFKEVCANSKFYRLDKGVGDPLTKIYWPAPRASLETISLSFRHPDGTLFDFGPDNDLPQPVNPLLQTTITLEIRTFVTDAGKAIGHRNP